MTEERESKRVRQACINCRRKKSRCTGEKPVCAICARLGQSCRYNDTYSSELAISSYANALQQQNNGLAARVALLESRLSLLNTNGNDGVSWFEPNIPAQRPGTADSLGPGSITTGEGRSSQFSSMPEKSTLESLTDTYFRCCHQQPYSFFHEGNFRRRLGEGTLPKYLVLSFAATAVRFSSDAQFVGRETEAMEKYGKIAWGEIIEQSFTDGYDLEMHAVQAASMLGILDYLAGRNELAWVKIGLSIRFAQTLQLGKEPDHSMTPDEAEERRNTFWSVYLLDRLVSCGRNRPPALLDSDCSIGLPFNPFSLTQDTNPERRTLAAMHEIPDTPLLEKTDHFALTIFAVSALAHVTRWAFKPKATRMHLPWDSRSEFVRIQGILLSFESYSDACDGNFAEVLDRHFVFHGILDEAMACHFIYSHVVYHVNQCLLHHPFLLRQQLKSLKVKVPVGFLRSAISKSREHAAQLTDILQILQQSGCRVHPSFYGYAAVIAGVIHRLHFMKTPQSHQAGEAEKLWEACLSFLGQEHIRWESYKRMSTILYAFDPSQELSTALLAYEVDNAPFEPAEEENLWQICDYGWLTSSSRLRSMSTPPPTLPQLPSALEQRQPITIPEIPVPLPEMATPPSATIPVPDPLTKSVSSSSRDSEPAPTFSTLRHSGSEFDMLMEGALSLDFSLLENVHSINDTNENLNMNYFEGI